jgi:dipeptidyl aminopeptidase/acylaminoacyl peptidase
MQPRTPVTPEHLFDLQFVDAVAVSGDGAKIVYQIRTIDAERDEYQSHLWLAGSDGSASRRLTQGEHRNEGAAFSPDRKWLAFVSNRVDKKAQVYRLPLDGGEAERLTDLDGTILGLAWSPDGATLTFAYRAADPPERGHLPGSIAEKKAIEAKAEKKEGKPPSFLHLTRLHYKEDGQGFLPRARFQIQALDVKTRALRALTSGEWDHGAPVWSPDGKWLAFAANRLPDSDYHPVSSDVWILPAAGGEPRNLTPQPGPAFSPAWSPDGSRIAFLGHTDDEDAWGARNIHVWTVPAQGGTPRDMTPDLDRTALDLVGSDLRDFHEGGGAFWSRDGRTIYFTASEHGSTHLFAVPAAGGSTRRLTSGSIQVLTALRPKHGDEIVAIRCGHADAGTVARFDPATGAWKALAEPNRPLFERLAVVEPEEYWIDAPEGHRIQCWMLKPPNADPGRGRHPMILEIHGGPRVQYGACYFHEFQIFANAGFYVLFTNPRGAQGYGEAFTRAIVQNWGGPDYDDVMRAVDEALRRYPEIDPARLGVTGGSYGGFMTNWIVGHTNRFKAALTQRSCVDLSTLFLAGDFGTETVSEFGDLPWRDPEAFRRMSPLTYVENVRTPLLITHSMSDHRCPVEEAEQLYTALKILRRDVELVLFPGESHGLSRGGTPSRRLARYHIMKDWFVKHLEPASPVGPSPSRASEPALSRAK